MVELYLTQHIEDRMLNGKRVSGAWKPKGQSDVRRTLQGDVVRGLGEKSASSITRKDIINLITEVIKRVPMFKPVTFFMCYRLLLIPPS
jgi:hypothetical protein